MLRKLTEKQRKFVIAYLGEERGNATGAARVAGYKSAEQSGYDLVRHEKVSAAIRLLGEEPAEHELLTLKGRRALLARIAAGEELDREGLEPEMKDRLKALDILGKSSGDYVQHIRHGIDVEGRSDSELDVRIAALLAKATVKNG